VSNGEIQIVLPATDNILPVMALAVSQDQTYCVSVAADHQVVRYDTKQGDNIKSIRSNSAGHACVAIREDNKIIAVGGWDGCVRLYDADLVQLGSLRYHKDTVQALSFVQTRILSDLKGKEQHGDIISDDDDDSDSDETSDGKDREKTGMADILVSGGKEGRICLWKT
jgi:WD40 repeat protein